jgi:DNA invertase Pin-like site-specific DNA recombinase
MAALLAHVASNGVRVILIERADRLARDLMVGELILAECRRLDVRVIDASGNDLANNADPTRVLIRQVLAAVAQFDRSTIVAKLRAGIDRMRRETGRREGRKPFGTRPGEAETLARMRALGRKPRNGKRLSYRGIAAVLDSEGLPSRSGKPWTAPVVKRLLERKTS